MIYDEELVLTRLVFPETCLPVRDQVVSFYVAVEPRLYYLVQHFSPYVDEADGALGLRVPRIGSVFRDQAYFCFA